MSYGNLHDFVKFLEDREELIRIKAPVSSYLEITEITDRISKSTDGGKALLFENVTNSSFPVLINLFGSKKRIALALDTNDLDLIGKRLSEMLEQNIPQTISDKFHLLKKGFYLSRYFPRLVKMAHPPCQEIILQGKDVDLTRLPILHCWPDDAGPFITLPVVIMKSLTSRKRNVGMYRLQIFDRNTTGMHWHIHKDGAHFFREYEKAGKKMEVAVVIGADPALTYAASAPMPYGLDEMLLAGFIRGKPVKLVPAVTVDLDVPAEAEIVLEGYVDPEERRLEGPFGDHTGYYSLPDLYPVFHVTAITHRRDAIYHTTIVGRPPMEDCYLALATERIFLPLLRTIMPEISDYWLPWEGVFHNVAVVAINKAYPGQTRKVMQGLWGSGQMSFCKAIVVVDGKMPLIKSSAVLREILSRVDLSSDLLFTEGILDVLDHASPCAFFGGKLGIDATERIKGEPLRRVFVVPESARSALEIISILKVMDEAFLACRLLFADLALPLFVFQIRKDDRKRTSFFRDMLIASKIIIRGIAVFYDHDVDINDDSLILWKGFNNVDPLRDIVIKEQYMIIDATKKSALDGHPRPWPGDVENKKDIKSRVEERLVELGISGLLGS